MSDPFLLSAVFRPAVRAHLLALDADDRYGRFGSALSDAGIVALAARLDFSRDVLLGVADGPRLLGLAHVVPAGAAHAELALSVAAPLRRRGLARALFAHAARLAAARGIGRFACIHGHPAVLRIAQGLGLAVRLAPTGPRALIELPCPTRKVDAGDTPCAGAALTLVSMETRLPTSFPGKPS